MQTNQERIEPIFDIEKYREEAKRQYQEQQLNFKEALDLLDNMFANLKPKGD